jgi:hypothetical protein
MFNKVRSFSVYNLTLIQIALFLLYLTVFILLLGWICYLYNVPVKIFRLIIIIIIVPYFYHAFVYPVLLKSLSVFIILFYWWFSLFYEIEISKVILVVFEYLKLILEFNLLVYILIKVLKFFKWIYIIFI